MLGSQADELFEGVNIPDRCDSILSTCQDFSEISEMSD